MLHPRDVMPVRDWILWAVVALLMTLENLAVDGYASGWPWLVASLLAVGVAIAFRRDHPLVAFVAAGAVTMAEMIQGAAGDTSFKIVHLGVLVLVAYLVGRQSDRARGFLALVVAGALVLGVSRVALGRSDILAGVVLTWFWSLIGCLIVVVLPWLYGRYRSQHARLLSAGWERAERMESEQRMAVEQARLRERNRIARDMHDSLGHELSLIALRAGALEVDRGLSERHRRSAAELRTSAAAATERLGELVGVLRADDAGASVQPAAETVDQVVERARASGMEIDASTEGERAQLPLLAEQAAARVVQEGLTNAAKHAPGEAVTVDIGWLEEVMELRVRNNLPRSGGTAPAKSGGHGLTGLDERLRLVGGELAYEKSGDRFELIARIPYDIGGTTREGNAAPGRSETASEHELVRARARRGLRTAITVPVAIGAVIGIVMLAYYYVLGYAAILDETDYDRIEVGQARDDVEDLLPKVEMIDAPNEAPTPDGASCEYYRSSGPFSGTFAYQMCFDDDVLVSKERVPTGSTSVEEER